MPVRSHTFWLPRGGNNVDEYEDASALDDSSGQYAVADGATEGCFTGLWARLLVADFVSRAELDASGWPSSLPAIQERWDADVRARKLDWDADYWLEHGAFAAFLGVLLANSPKTRFQDSPLPLGEGPQAVPGVRAATCEWQAVAVGDTCVFHTRDSALLRAFPLDRSDQFGNRPQLVGSRMPIGEVLKRQRLWSDGCGQPGDRLWLMTDALAKWCLTEREAGGNPWLALESFVETATNLPSPFGRGATNLPSPFGRGAGGEGALQRETADTHFASWIESLRDAGCLLNDDVTLLAIRL